MPRPRIHPLSASGTTNAARSAAWRAKQRIKNNLPAPLTVDEQRALDRRADTALIATIRASLVKRGARGLADRLYPLRDGAAHRAVE